MIKRFKDFNKINESFIFSKEYKDFEKDYMIDKDFFMDNLLPIKDMEHSRILLIMVSWIKNGHLTDAYIAPVSM